MSANFYVVSQHQVLGLRPYVKQKIRSLFNTFTGVITVGDLYYSKLRKVSEPFMRSGGILQVFSLHASHNCNEVRTF